MGLTARFVVTNVALLFIVLLSISGWVIGRHASELKRENEARAETLRTSLHSKGQRRTRILATFAQRVAASTTAEEQARELPYLAEVIAATVKNDPETKYGMVMDNTRRVLVHTNPKLIGTVLDDRSSRLAAESAKESESEVDGLLEVSGPILTPKGERFGTIRFGIYTNTLDKQIDAAQAQVDAVINSGVRTTLMAVALLLVLGTALGTLAGRRLLRPLVVLGEAADALRRGELDKRLAIGGAPEIDRLSRTFNQMTDAIAERDALIQRQLSEVRDALAKEEQANRLRREFLANVTHELRTPLNAIVNVPATLLRELDAPEEHKRMLRRVEQAGKHLLKVVNDLLDAAKLEASKMTLEKGPVELRPLLETVVETLSGLAEAQHQTLALDVADAPATVVADGVRLTQVLINLVGNAIKFTPAHGDIRIRAARRSIERQPVVQFSVTDSGPGIPASELENVFQSFRQLDGSHTKAQGGTGLGLTISRQLVELHGGKIWCESTLGQGTTFHFYIPWTEAPRLAPEPERVQSALPKNARSILYVEDEDMNWEVAEHALRSRYKLTRARNAHEAFAAVTKDRFDAILMDIQLKGSSLDGIEITRVLKGLPIAKPKDNAVAPLQTPIIFVTAFASLYSKDTLQASGGAEVLTKPVDFATLSLTLTRLMMREVQAQTPRN